MSARRRADHAAVLLLADPRPIVLISALTRTSMAADTNLPSIVCAREDECGDFIPETKELCPLSLSLYFSLRPAFF